MKINIKVKHLILTALTLVLLVPLVSFVIIPQINLYLAEKRLADGEQVDKEKIVELLGKPLFNSQKWELIQHSMLDDGPAHRYDVYVGPSFTQTTTTESGINFTWNEKLPYIKKYVKEGPVNGFLTTAARNLATYYAERDNWGQADKVLESTAERFNDGQHHFDRQALQLERVRLAMQNHQLDAAEQLMQTIIETMGDDDANMQAETAKIRARLILQQGNVLEAHQSIQKALASYENMAKEEENYDDEFPIENDVQFEQLQSLEWRLERILNQNAGSAVTVKGTIQRANGEPLKHAGVFLRNKSVVNQSVRQEEPYQTVTDEKGTYEFHGVVPGDYQITLGFSFDQIDGWTYPAHLKDWIDIEGNDVSKDITLQKLIEIESPVNKTKITGETMNFAWKKVNGAAYYNLNVSVPIDGGSIGTGLKTHITSTDISVPVEELYNQSSNILLEDEKDGADPLGLLGLANPKSRFAWNVEAFDKDDNLITRSNGYRLNEDTLGNLPFFYLKTRDLTEADHTLLEGDVEGALKAYMNGHEKNPDDMHNVRMIVRLLGMKGDGTKETRDELVFPYVKTLAEETGSLQYVRNLLNYYYDERDWEEFETWYRRYKKHDSYEIDAAIESFHAKALVKQGEFEKASQAFQVAVPLDLYHSDIRNWLAVELYQATAFERVRRIAADYPEYDSFAEGPSWEQMISDMNAEAQGKQDAYLRKIQFGLGLYFEGKNTELNKWLEKMKEPALAKFIEQLGEMD